MAWRVARAAGVQCPYGARANRSQTPKKLLNPNGREPTTELFGFGLSRLRIAAKAPYSIQTVSPSSSSSSFFLSFAATASRPQGRVGLRGQDTDATNRRIPHHQVTSVPSVCPSVDLFPRFQNCERCASERGRSEIWWMDCGGKDVCMGRNWNWK